MNKLFPVIVSSDVFLKITQDAHKAPQVPRLALVMPIAPRDDAAFGDALMITCTAYPGAAVLAAIGEPARRGFVFQDADHHTTPMEALVLSEQVPQQFVEVRVAQQWSGIRPQAKSALEAPPVPAPLADQRAAAEAPSLTTAIAERQARQAQEVAPCQTREDREDREDREAAKDRGQTWPKHPGDLRRVQDGSGFDPNRDFA